jgi:hypothetical protein
MKNLIIKEDTEVIWMSLEIPNVTSYNQFVSCNIRLQLDETDVLSHFLVCPQSLALVPAIGLSCLEAARSTTLSKTANTYTACK